MTFPKRVNVSFSLEGEMDKYARRLNAIVVEAGNGEIDFCQGKALPHVTLLMGTVSEPSHLNDLVAKVAKFRLRQPSVSFHVSQPYFATGLRGYIFLDVLPGQSFTDLRLALHEHVDGLLEYEEHGGPMNQSHITVGYSRNADFDLGLLDESPMPEGRGIADLIQVAEVGHRGTCTHLISTSPIGLPLRQS